MPQTDDLSARRKDNRRHGVSTAIVTDNVDPQKLGRLRVKLPDVGEQQLWCRLATLMAGNERGSWFIPDVGDEVLVAFADGDAAQPFVIGSLWNPTQQPPESMDEAGRNDHKVLRSRNGLQLTLDDRTGEEQFVLETPGGQRVTLRDAPGGVAIADSNGNHISLDAAGVQIHAATKVDVSASLVEVRAGAVVVEASSAQFRGIVQCDTLIANNVIGSSYTPGVGNIS